MATVARPQKTSRPAQKPVAAAEVRDQPAQSRVRKLLVACASYVAAAGLSTVILARIMKLWHADLSVPMNNFWDALLTQMWVKGIFEHGWYLHNPSLGAPAGMDMHDFPMADSLHFLLIKLLCLASPNYAVAFNLYYLIGFPLATLSALFVLRRFDVSYPSALIAGLLYTFLPYHFVRGQQHLFLAGYYIVPLSMMVALWLYLGRIGAARESEARREPGERWRWFGALTIAALQSCAGVYYAFFACFLLLAAGVAAALDTRRWRPLTATCVLAVVTSAGVVANVTPSLLYWREHGSNPAVAHRDPQDADIHGLKIGQLLLPDSQHRLDRFARVRQKYDRWPLADGEKQGASLGIIGAVGFLFLVGLLLRRRSRETQPSILSALATFNVITVLLATIGGFGSLFNFLVSPQIRCYNRLSIFIALFSLSAVALLLDRLAEWWTNQGRPKWQLAALLTLLTFVGIIDEAGRGRVPNYAGLNAEFTNDAEFIGRVEGLLPANAMVFQLPYFPFPESPPIYGVGEYQQFRPYFHSSSLRWSYGVMKGREEDAWQREAAAQPTARFLDAIAEKGFQGIYIDRFGYADRAAGLEAELTNLLGAAPHVSQDERMSFFALPLEQPLEPVVAVRRNSF
jgi:phosphoglycerol transferase